MTTPATHPVHEGVLEQARAIADTHRNIAELAVRTKAIHDHLAPFTARQRIVLSASAVTGFAHAGNPVTLRGNPRKTLQLTIVNSAPFPVFLTTSAGATPTVGTADVVVPAFTVVALPADADDFTIAADPVALVAFGDAVLQVVRSSRPLDHPFLAALPRLALAPLVGCQTTAPLGISGSFTSPPIPVPPTWKRLAGTVSSDAGGTLNLQIQRLDGTFETVQPIAVVGGTPSAYDFPIPAAIARLQYANGAGAQTRMSLDPYVAGSL